VLQHQCAYFYTYLLTKYRYRFDIAIFIIIIWKTKKWYWSFTSSDEKDSFMGSVKWTREPRKACFTASFHHWLIDQRCKRLSMFIKEQLLPRSIYCHQSTVSWDFGSFVVRQSWLLLQLYMYTVNHKKRDILFLTITWLILTDFYSFHIVLIVKKFYMRL